MALFGQEDKATAKDTQPKPPPLAMAQPAAGSESGSPSVARERPESEARSVEGTAAIGRGSRVVGKLFFDGSARIEGQVEGEIDAQDTLVVGERAVVNARIHSGTVVIRGQTTGDINADKRVEIHPPGKLYGNIVTPSLVIHEGVVFEGHCSMGVAAKKEPSETKV